MVIQLSDFGPIIKELGPNLASLPIIYNYADKVVHRSAQNFNATSVFRHFIQCVQKTVSALNLMYVSIMKASKPHPLCASNSDTLLQ